MGKGQRARQRKRLAKLGDEARRAAKRQRQQQGGEEAAGAAASAAAQRPAEQIALIRAFHTLEKKLAAVATDSTLRDDAAREARRTELRAEQEAMGGLDAYQKASLAGESTQAYAQFSAAEWVLEELGGKPLVATHKSAQRTEPVVLPGGPDRPDTAPLQLLDVGAIVNHYPAEPEPEAEPAPAALRSHSTLGPKLPGGRRLLVTSIDLNAQEPSVIEADFFDFAAQQLALPRDTSSGARYDVIVLSLVMNFVGDASMRGVMIKRCAELLGEGGLLFLVLPEPCLYNSRGWTDTDTDTDQQ
jgi:25S rRNA (adenine2142-N1)-methyltransferase